MKIRRIVQTKKNRLILYKILGGLSCGLFGIAFFLGLTEPSKAESSQKLWYSQNVTKDIPIWKGTNSSLFHAKGPTYSVSFPDTTNTDISVLFSKGTHTISLTTPRSQSFGKLTVSRATAHHNVLSYPNIFNTTDLVYSTNESGILEELIVKSPTDAKKIQSLTQTIALEGLRYVVQPDGSLAILNGPIPIFTLPPPILYEKNNPKEKNAGIIYLTSLHGNTLTVTKHLTSIGKKWLSDPNRVYPVVIDATVDTGPGTINISGSQRTTWHDGTRHWVSFHNGTSIEFWYSTDGNSWSQNTNATLASTSEYTLTADSSGAYIIYAVTDGSYTDLYVRKALSYPGSSFSWDTAVLKADSINGNLAYYPPMAIQKAKDNYLWVAYKKCTDIANGCSAGTSFPAGTHILLPHGKTKEIQNIKPGDLILSFNKNTNQTETDEVYAIKKREVESYLSIQTRSATVSITPNHPVYVGNGVFTKAESLHIGDRIGVFRGKSIYFEPIQSLERIHNRAIVYNLSIKKNETFFANSIAVHNVTLTTEVYRSTTANSVSSWSLINSGAGQPDSILLIPATSDATTIIMLKNYPTSITTQTCTSSSCGSESNLDTGIAGTDTFSAAPGINSQTVHLAYMDNNTINYAYYNGSSWSTPITLYSTGINTKPSVTYDSSTNYVYVSWVNGTTIFTYRGVTPFINIGNWNPNSTSDSNGVNYFTTQEKTNASFIGTWVETQSPYAIIAQQLPVSFTCTFPQSGSYSLPGSCTYAEEVNGVEAGNLTVPAGTTLTLNQGQTLIWNSGQSITVNGSIAIANGASLRQGNIFVKDTDGDTYPNSILFDTQTATISASASLPGYTRKKDLGSISSADCNNSSSSLYQNLDLYIDKDLDGRSPTASHGIVCVGGATQTYGRWYYADINGYNYLTTPIATNDCQDTGINALAVYSPTTCYDNSVDNDGDGHTIAYTYSCTNNSTCTNVTYASQGEGTNVVSIKTALSQTPALDDCNDGGTNSNLVWVYKTCYIDSDGDGYTSGSVSCTNNATCTSATAGSGPEGSAATTYSAGRLLANASAITDVNDNQRCADSDTNTSPTTSALYNTTCKKCVNGGLTNQSNIEDLWNQCSAYACSSYVWGWNGNACKQATTSTGTGMCDDAGACRALSVSAQCAEGSTSVSVGSSGCQKACPQGGVWTSYDTVAEIGYTDSAQHGCPAGQTCNTTATCTSSSGCWKYAGVCDAGCLYAGTFGPCYVCGGASGSCSGTGVGTCYKTKSATEQTSFYDSNYDCLQCSDMGYGSCSTGCYPVSNQCTWSP